MVIKMVDLYRFKQLILNDGNYFNKKVIKDSSDEIIIEAYENWGSFSTTIYISCDRYGLAQVEFVTTPSANKSPEFFDADCDLRFYLSRFSDRNNLFMINGKTINGKMHYSLLFNDRTLRNNINNADDAFRYCIEALNCFTNTSVRYYLDKVVSALRKVN